MQKIVFIAAAIIIAFVFGLWCAPESVRVETKVVEVEKKVVERDKHKETVVVEVVKPDGTKETTTTTVEDTKTVKDSTTTTDASTVEETKRAASKVTILGMAGLNTGVNPVYGLSVSKPILGPITVGAWGTTEAGGVSLGLTF